ncbi:MAG: hypothetical protein R2822_19930 [Spirosomataceae bacterium]
MVDFAQMDKDDYGYDWAIEAREHINHYLLNGDYQPFDSLPATALSLPTGHTHPRPLLPLIYTLGLQQKENI